MPSAQSGVLLATVLTTGGFHTFPAVPSGHRWIHKSASLAYFGGSPSEVAHGIQRSGSDHWLTNVMGVPNNGVVSWNGWHVLESGDAFRIYLEMTASLTVWLSGVDITL